MKTATIRQVRHDFSTLLGWIEGGEPVTISKRGRVVALLTPPPKEKAVKTAGKTRPDFAARLRRIYGSVTLPGENSIVAERDSSRR